ncbi:MAG: hypothetical protein ACK5RF_14560, partial [Pirellula sp.]
MEANAEQGEAISPRAQIGSKRKLAEPQSGQRWIAEYAPANRLLNRRQRSTCGHWTNHKALLDSNGRTSNCLPQ